MLLNHRSKWHRLRWVVPVVGWWKQGAESRGHLRELASCIRAVDTFQGVLELSRDGIIESANAAYLSMMGYTLREIQGRHHHMFLDDESARSHHYAQDWDELQRGHAIRGEFRRRNSSGEDVWIQGCYAPITNKHGQVTKIVSLATDITRLKMSLMESQAQLAAISKSQAVIEFALDGQILNANQNFLTTMGYTLDEVRGKYHRLFVEPQYSLSVEYAQFWNDLRAGRFHSAQFRRRAKGGREVWIQATYNAILNQDGEPFKIVKYATDITPTKRLEQEARELAMGASAVAARGGQVVQDAVTAMDHIDKSSQRIADIISAIDDIAFQTSLLSLNAAVEAAHAGAHGQGFAIVASEVRDLAQRSAVAAKEIKTLIQDSGEKVARGTALVNKSGDTLTEIVESVKRVTDIVAEIATVS